MARKNEIVTTTLTSGKTVNVVIDRLAWIRCCDLTSAELRLIERRCIFIPKKDRYNPEPKPVYASERITVDGYEYLGVPVNYFFILKKDAHGSVDFKIEDRRNDEKVRHIDIKFPPRDYQYPLVRAMLDQCRTDNGCSVLEASTGAGKTYMFQYVRNKMRGRALLPFHKTKLIRRWVKAVEEFEPDAKIGIIGTIEEPAPTPDNPDKTKKVTYFDFEGCDYVFVCYQTLISKGFEKKLIAKGWTLEQFSNYFSMIGFDEANKGGAPEWSAVMKMFTAKYRIAFSGTLNRADGNTELIHMFCGPTVAKYEGLASEEPDVYFVQTGLKADLERNPNFGKMVLMRYAGAYLSKVTFRNQLIVAKIFQALEKERVVLVFCHTHVLLNKLYEITQLNIANKNMDYVISKHTGKASLREIERCENDANVIFATYKDADDGIDIPRIDTVFFCDPKGNGTQAGGRALRSFTGDDKWPAKKKPLWLYFCDQTPQSKQMMYAFLRSTVEPKGYNNNFKTLKELYEEKQQAGFRRGGKVTKPKVVVRRKNNV